MEAVEINLGRVKGGIWYTGSANTPEAITEDILTAGYTPINLDIYLCNNGDYFQYLISDGVPTWVLQGTLKGLKGDTGAQGPKGAKGDIGPQGPKGEKGEKGDPFTVAKTFTNVAEMNAGFASDGVAQGSFVIIDTGNIEDVENAQLYLKGANGYVYITDLSGAPGIKGEKGDKGDSYLVFKEQLTLTATDWTENEQTLLLEGIVGDIRIYPVNQSAAEFVNCFVACTKYENSILTFECVTLPENDLEIIVEYRGVE